MNISKKFLEIWNKFNKAGRVYLKTLLIVLGVAGALFVGHKLDASAEHPEQGICVEMAGVGQLVNFPPEGAYTFPPGQDDSLPSPTYTPFYVKFTDQGVEQPGTLLLSGPYSGNTGYYFEGSFTRNPAPSYGDRFTVYTNKGEEGNDTYDAISGSDEPFVSVTKDIPSDEDYFKTSFEGLVKAIGRRPKVIIKDIDGTDISSDKFIVQSNFEFTKENDAYKYKINRLTIQPIPASNIPWDAVGKLNLEKGGDSFTWDPDTKDITIDGYTSEDIVFSCKGKAYFGSATNGDSQSPWQNRNLADGYALKLGNTNVSTSDNFDKGAWMIEYPVYDISSTWNLTLESKTGYGFENNCTIDKYDDGSRVDGYPKTVSSTDNNKKLPLAIENTSKREQIVTIGGQKYSDFTNTLRYGSSSHKLTDLVDRIYYYFVIDDTKIPKDTINGKFFQTWTIAGVSEDTVKFPYYVYPCTGYEFDRDITVSVNGNQLPWSEEGGWQDRYSTGYDAGGNNVMEIVYNSAFQNNEIVINNIKKHYDVKFKPEAGSTVESDININGSASNWNKSITGNVPFDGKFTVNLDVSSDSKTFKDADEVRTAIINKNSDLSGLECVKNTDKQVTLTIPHSTSERTIIIPDDVLNWKKSDVDFLISFEDDIDEEYREEVFKAIKLHKGSDPQSTDLISLKEVSSSTLANMATQRDVSYNNLFYTLTIDNDNNYAEIDPNKISVSVDGGVPNEVSWQTMQDNPKVLKFNLNSGCPDAEYKKQVKFNVTGLSAKFKQVPFTLCPKAVLYLKRSDGTTKHIATAPSDVGAQINVNVPENGGANYVVMYPDSSKKFDKENIETHSSGVTNVELESFNRVSFHVDATQADAKVICDDPAEAAPPLKFTPIEGAKYYGVKDGAIDMNSPIQGTISIPYAQEYSFAVKCNEGYDHDSLQIRANGTDFSTDESAVFKKKPMGDYYILTIAESEATYPITITGTAHPMQKKITFNKNLGGSFGNCDYIYNGASVGQSISVLYGQGIAFEVTLPEKCNQSDIVVKFNDEQLSKVNGKYILNNITSDGTISVSNVSLNKYPVTFMSNSRATYRTKDGGSLSGNVDVSHGDSFEFRVQPNSGYTMGENSVVYLRYANGQTTTLKPNNDVYKINNVTQACTISVENVEDIVYTVRFIPVDGVTYRNDVDNVVKDTVKVRHGRNFEFSVSLSDEYDDSLGGMNIIVNDGKSAQSSAQKLASGRYVIPNVSEDITIKVGNVRKNTYTVTLTGAEGIDYYNSSGQIITGDNQAEHHSDFSFKVDLYPAYAGSNITVMLGDTPMSPDSNGFYTIPKISESKTVTVVGIEQSDSSELVNKINNLPDSLGSLGDVDDVIAATKAYESLSDAEKALVGNADKLKSLQEQVKEFHHVSNDVRISGVDWYIKLYAIPITDDTEACGRIYKKLGSEYILSLYNVYLWNTLTDSRYTLPEGQSAVVTLPTPDMTYFEKPTAIHEKDGGKLEFISATINRDTTVFQTDSFSPMGIVANRSSTPGRSSLLDAADANLDAISNFAASVFGNNTNRVTRSDSDRGDSSDLSGNSDDDMSGNIDEKFRSRNNKTTALSSALRLVLVLMILILIGLMIYFFMKRRKDNKDGDKE